MSLRTLIEIVIHVDTFRNIDLYFQGIYYNKLKLYYKRKKPENSLNPPDTDLQTSDPHNPTTLNDQNINPLS